MWLVPLASLAACEQHTPPHAAVAPPSHLPSPVATTVADAPLNSTDLRADVVASAFSKMSTRFTAPEPNQVVAGSAPRSYEVRLLVDVPEPDALGIDVALDGQRPRRLPSARAVTTLSQLLPVDGELAEGEHWLFAAPILASGLVPRVNAEALRSAVARRFFVTSQPGGVSNGSGAVWLRKPEGTYNGPSSQRLLFDLFSFDEQGAALGTVCTIALEGERFAGKLRLAAPFALLEVPSGNYRVGVSAPAARAMTWEFTVNRELGGGP